MPENLCFKHTVTSAMFSLVTHGLLYQTEDSKNEREHFIVFLLNYMYISPFIIFLNN